MSSATFPDPEPEPQSEPAGSGSQPVGSGSQPVPAGGSDGAPEPGDDEDSAAYIGELMAAAAAGEELTTDDISQAGFGQGGTADQMCPGPDLATLIHAATTNDKILATVSDDDLIGILRGARRLESLAAWAEMTTLREFATRRTDPPPLAAPSPADPSPADPSPADPSPRTRLRPPRLRSPGSRSASSRPMSWPRT